MKKLIVLGILLVILNGCSSPKPAIGEYRLSPSATLQMNSKGSCTNSSLKVLQADGLASMMSLRMHYRQGDNREHIYNESQWSDSIAQMVAREFERSIREAALFESVQGAKSRASSDYVLEINIEEFIQSFDEKLQSSHALVSLTLTLINTKENRVERQKSFSESVEAKTLDAKGGVEALNRAMIQILGSALVWLEGACG